jgi:hypothetical protein
VSICRYEGLALTGLIIDSSVEYSNQFSPLLVSSRGVADEGRSNTRATTRLFIIRDFVALTNGDSASKHKAVHSPTFLPLLVLTQMAAIVHGRQIGDTWK